MSGHPSRRRPAASPLCPSFGAGGRVVGVVCCLLLVASGCNLSAPEREEAQAVVDADNRDADVQVVTSTEFDVAGGGDPGQPPGVSLLIADTTVQPLPFERSFDISATGRFFIRAQTPEAASDTPSVNTTIRVVVDGDEVNFVQGDLADDPVQAVFVAGN